MHEEIFARPSGKGNFMPLKYRPPVEMTDAEYPLMLMTGRRLYHYHATMTRKVDVLNILMNEEECQINPADAASLGINQADIIQVASRHGEVKVRARVTDAVPPGVVHMAFHFAETPTNELISSAKETLDPVTGTPAYKTCPVKISKHAVTGKEAMLSVFYRASREPGFIAQLARDPEDALKTYKLNDAEKAAILSGDFTKIESLTGKLNDRLKVWLLSRSEQEKW
jgi:predicted molibdopterin-dependent oxidoreductase YjgC